MTDALRDPDTGSEPSTQALSRMDEAKEIIERLDLLQKQVELLRAYTTARLEVLKAALFIVAGKAGCAPDKGELAKLMGTLRRR